MSKQGTNLGELKASYQKQADETVAKEKKRFMKQKRKILKMLEAKVSKVSKAHLEAVVADLSL